jgi:hypothetical protein
MLKFKDTILIDRGAKLKIVILIKKTTRLLPQESFQQ